VSSVVAELRDRVASISIVAGDAEHVVVPAGSAVVLGLQFRGRIRAGDALLSTAGVTGIQSAARSYQYLEGAASVLVRFTATGASALGVPVSELADGHVALTDLLPRASVERASERLAVAQGDDARRAAIEALLLPLASVRCPLVSRAVRALDGAVAAGPPMRIAELCRTLGVSERQLERRFAAIVGTSPRHYQTLRRFERALAIAASEPRLSRVALQAGYYDQAQFTREFRRHAGASPRAWLREQR
jgi:AraC-like DNA-binding protein